MLTLWQKDERSGWKTGSEAGFTVDGLLRDERVVRKYRLGSGNETLEVVLAPVTVSK